MVWVVRLTHKLVHHVIESLEYRLRTFKSTALQLQSLDKRMTNIMNLSFHSVTQQDSLIMQNDINAMRLIAVMTLMFLPATGVASVYSSPFFQVDFNGSCQPVQVAESFKYFWAVVLPLTFIVIVFWWVWYVTTKHRRSGSRFRKLESLQQC